MDVVFDWNLGNMIYNVHNTLRLYGFFLCGNQVVLAGAQHDEEWVPSRTGEVELNRLVEAGVLPNCAITGWRPALGESFPTPHTDKAVVFKDYF